MIRSRSKLIALLGSIAFCLALMVGCNTTEGVGQDIEAAGEAISDAADGE